VLDRRVSTHAAHEHRIAARGQQGVGHIGDHHARRPAQQPQRDIDREVLFELGVD
jgi:hypothetical protein